MPTLRNTSERIIYIDGVMILPKASGEVSAEALKFSGVEALIASKCLEEVQAAPKAASAPAAAPPPPPAPKA